IDFGEEGDPKGFCWVEVQRGKAHYQFIELQTRPFVTLRADLRQSANPTDEVVKLIGKHDLKEAVVRVLVQLTLETEARFNEGIVRDVLRRANVSHIAVIRKEVEQPDRARLGASPEGLTPPELLERYLMSKDVLPERRHELLGAAQDIFDSVSANESS
ncbi:MAG: exonuclease SbcCD subunit D, partial [Burkholderiales bacterium]|nr:exonuclease SbcCD subunit D [Anaerolineae bacterium]